MKKKLSFPEDGLVELFRSWSGKGELYAGLAAVLSEDDFEWTKDDVERRAHVILFEQCRPLIEQLPENLQDWLSVLPVATQAETVRGRSPRGAINWANTRRQGWPPTEFSGRVRHRGVDDELLSSLRWTVERLLGVHLHAKEMRPKIGKGVRGQLATLDDLAARPELQGVEAEPPDLLMVEGIRRAGPLWRVVGDLADLLRREESGDLARLAAELLAPDDALRWRLFHLCVLGTMLGVLRSLKCRTISRRPLAGRSRGPAFRVEAPGAAAWDLWFEAGEIWSTAKKTEPYVEATRGLARRGNVRGADLFLVDHANKRAVVIECKYSDEGKYLRSAYDQALAYLVEARTLLIDEGEAFVVAPIEAVPRVGVGRTLAGPLIYCAPEHLKGELTRVFSGWLAS
ncbi:hypothetical protein [Amycolatopsis sp. NPDC049868]|uniref:hypothetical protein n=1 Tax=Amycolatopsis sp. NPDC049868 TaxID=3363934 RepID=UPI0037B12584